MSATLPNSNLSSPPPDVIWSRGGGSFRRLLWKEVCEVVGLCGVFALVTLVAAVLARSAWESRKEMFSLPVLVLQLAPTVFSLIVGARAFAREVERGTWELLRSAGASAWDVWSSKMLVASISTLGIAALSGAAIAVSLGEPIYDYLPGLFLFSPRLLLMLVVSMQCSLCSRKVWTAMLLSAALLLPSKYALVYLAAEWIATHPIVLGWLDPVILFALVLLGTTQLRQMRRQLHDESAIRESRRWWKVFWRMVWKELLAARDFWLAVIGILIVLDGGACWLFRESTTRDGAIIGLGIMMSLLHSLGCGAIAFAIEREDWTQVWLRHISAPPGAVFTAKLVVSQASIVSLTSLVMFGSQWIVSESNLLTGEQCAGVLLAATLNGVVGLGASMLTRRVLPAMFAALVGVIVFDWLLLSIRSLSTHRHPFDSAEIGSILAWCLFSGLVLVAVECWLSDRWLNERSWWRRSETADTPKMLPPKPSVTLFEQSSSPALKAFGRLLWREWMQVGGWWWALPIAFAPSLMHALNEVDIGASFVQTWGVRAFFWLLAIPATLLPMLPMLCGVWAFHHDQQQGLFRFLSDRGGSPASIWLSKQVIWLPFVLVLAVLAGALIGYADSGRQFEWWFYVGFAVVGALQCFAAGQFCSQLIRSSVTSIFVAGVLSVMLGFWTAVLWQVRTPWPDQLGAAAILLFASWMRSRDWLEERSSWRAWLRVDLSVVLPATALVLALEVHGFPVCRTIRTYVILH